MNQRPLQAGHTRWARFLWHGPRSSAHKHVEGRRTDARASRFQRHSRRYEGAAGEIAEHLHNVTRAENRGHDSEYVILGAYVKYMTLYAGVLAQRTYFVSLVHPMSVTQTLSNPVPKHGTVQNLPSLVRNRGMPTTCRTKDAAVGQPMVRKRG